jgi:hypothetical protein
MWNENEQVWVEGGKKMGVQLGLYWYAAPSVVSPSSLHQKPFSLAIALHNAKTAEGRLTPLGAMLHSANAQPETHKSGTSKDAEELLEETRKRVNSNAPSRLACFFVSSTKDIAIKRHHEIRGQREIVACKIMLDGTLHVGDIRLYDDLCNRLDEEKAKQYWQPFQFETNKVPEEHLEILVGASLYFPEWQTFPTLNVNELTAWEAAKKLFL